MKVKQDNEEINEHMRAVIIFSPELLCTIQNRLISKATKQLPVTGTSSRAPPWSRARCGCWFLRPTPSCLAAPQSALQAATVVGQQLELEQVRAAFKYGMSDFQSLRQTPVSRGQQHQDHLPPQAQGTGAHLPGNSTRSLAVEDCRMWAWYHTLEPATISNIGCI